jgi:hypothetical protein
MGMPEAKPGKRILTGCNVAGGEGRSGVEVDMLHCEGWDGEDSDRFSSSICNSNRQEAGMKEVRETRG